MADDKPCQTVMAKLRFGAYDEWPCPVPAMPESDHCFYHQNREARHIVVIRPPSRDG